MEPVTPSAEKPIEAAIAVLLRAGVLLASVISLAGAFFLWPQVGGQLAAYGRFRSQSPDLSTLHGILRGAFSGHADSVMQVGLLVLIATPIARVVLSLIGFLLEGDRLYVGLTFLVLVILSYSLLS